MNDLVAWLRSDIEHELALARAAGGAPWVGSTEHFEVQTVEGLTVVDGFEISDPRFRATIDHIVRHDPAATIDRCESDLAILSLHEHAHGCGGPADSRRWVSDDEDCPTVRLLAYGRRHHRPGWREEWKP
ncbi:DUF6221 family protein [Sphaerisporangium corydalis]|uniref:DUF6221 family protein n=1 Tax=Sphaerisporangium corydalis TaxID=1441875 RepID=A0ABV9EGC8_9ACTN|nr:DUF6221 family protein [Sphaerisporangium corydalis]